MHDGLKPDADGLTQYWFKPKRYGYGATPITWEGWAVTAAAVACVVVLAMVFVAEPASRHAGPDLPGVLIWAALNAAIIGGLLWITRAKTDGEWKWRWGGDE